MSKRLIGFCNRGETFMITFSKNGGRKILIAAILLSLICLFTLINMNRIKADTLDGVVIKIQDSCILMDSLDENEPGPVKVSYPDNFDISEIMAGDKIRVYYTGGIAESYPCQINKTIKIKKIE